MHFFNKSFSTFLVWASIMAAALVSTIAIVLAISSVANASQPVPISNAIFETRQLLYVSHKGFGPLDTALAMNIPYEPVRIIREQLSRTLGHSLKFFQGWNKNGEAHITVVTPPEYANYLRNFIKIERIEQIAQQMGIQYSDISILGIGRGASLINGKSEETYFLIITSNNLLKIRQQIYREYLAHGSPANVWNPNHFYPHITIGFSLRDLHESDGVIKDVTHSFDSRFKLFLVR